MLCNLQILTFAEVFTDIGERFPHIAGDILLTFENSRAKCHAALNSAPFLSIKMREIGSCIVQAARDNYSGRIDGQKRTAYSFDEMIDSGANVDTLDMYDDTHADILESLTTEAQAISVLETIADEYGRDSKYVTIAGLLAQGLTQQEIASHLGTSQQNVYFYIAQIRRLFGV